MQRLIFLIKAFFLLIIQNIQEWFFNKGLQASFSRAKKLANRKFKIDGKTYFIIQGERWLFFIGSTMEIDRLKRVRVFSKNLNVKSLNEISCYKVGASCPLGNDRSDRLILAKS